MYTIYQVMPGETIESISNKLGITTIDLINLNGLSEPITAGQLIVIPNQNNLFDTYIIQKGDNLYDIARRNNMNVEELLKINGLDKDDFIYPEQQILIPKQGINVYVTEENETLNNVINKLGTDLQSLINQNDNVYLLPDQIIVYRN